MSSFCVVLNNNEERDLCEVILAQILLKWLAQLVLNSIKDGLVITRLVKDKLRILFRRKDDFLRSKYSKNKTDGIMSIDFNINFFERSSKLNWLVKHAHHPICQRMIITKAA